MLRPDRSAAVTGAAALAVIAIAALAIFAIPASEAPLTHRAASDGAQFVGVSAGAALVIASLLKAKGYVALLLLALAAVWFAQDVAALGGSAALVRSIAGDTGVSTGVLDPIGAEIAEGPALYRTMMERLATALVKCLVGGR
jgi:hypothetical protein